MPGGFPGAFGLGAFGLGQAGAHWSKLLRRMPLLNLLGSSSPHICSGGRVSEPFRPLETRELASLQVTIRIKKIVDSDAHALKIYFGNDAQRRTLGCAPER